MKFAKLCLCWIFLCCTFFLKAQVPPGTFQEVKSAGSPFPARTNPASSAFSPLTTTGHVFTAIPNFGDVPGTVSVYELNQVSGALTTVPPGTPFMTGTSPAWQAFSPITPTGKLFSAVANFNNGNLPGSVSAYIVDPTTGTFTPVVGSPFTAGEQNTSAVQFSPITSSGLLFAAVVNATNSSINVYLVDQMSGFFTPVSTVLTGQLTANFVAFSPITSSGQLFAAVVNLDSNNVSVYNVDQSNGSFTPVPGSIFSTGVNPYNVQFSPITSSGQLFAAVVNNNGGNIGSVSVFEVDQSSGVFTEIISAGSPFPAGTSPNTVAFSPIVGGYLIAAVTNFNDSTVSVYQMNQATGALNAISGSPFATGMQPNGIAFSPIVSGNLFADVANLGSNNVSVYQVAIPPAVTSISPTSGPSSGNTSVTITGIGFNGATAVNFGTTPALSFTVISSTEINAISPPGSGIVDVTVITPVATSAITSADQFTYLSPPPPVIIPAVRCIKPHVGPLEGGTIVKIKGSGFTGAIAVDFGSTSALSFIVVSDSLIIAIAPPGRCTVNVTVTIPEGTSRRTKCARFTYKRFFPNCHFKGLIK